MKHKVFSEIGKTKITTVSTAGQHFTVGPSQCDNENKKQKNCWWRTTIHLYIRWLCTLIIPQKKSIGKYSKLASQTPNNLELNFNYLQSTKNTMNLTINLQDILPFKEKNHIILEWKDIINGAINSWIGKFSTIKFSSE